MSMRRILIAITLTMAIALAAGCSASSDEMSAGSAAQEEAEAPAQDVAPAAPNDAGGEAAGGDAAADTDASVTGDTPAVADLVAAQNDRIVREGTMRVEVDEGRFDRAFNQVVAAAARHGGTVLASDASSDDAGLTSGSVTVRVPADSYDALLTSVAEIGEVRERSITSQDVSGEFVDLEARLRHNEAQERFYLSLLERAEGVEDAIAVQQRVSEIQQTIEQIRGRLTFLEERTSFSRLTVELYETGSAFQEGDGTPPTFAQYWEASRNALVNVLGVTMVLLTILLPFAVVGGLIFFVIRRVRPRRRRTLPPPPGPPVEPATPEPATSGAPARPDGN
jgi:Domain of unknown function (DUF4349)